jgi:hypothetical protein
MKELNIINKKALEVKVNNQYFTEQNSNPNYCDVSVGAVTSSGGDPGIGVTIPIG